MELNTFFDLCSGIGGGRLGLEMAGLKPVGYSDTSRLSATTYKLMFDTGEERNFGNLKKIKTEKLPSFDVLIAGFPCQTFSVIGRREGFDDIRGQIIFHIARILSETKPKAFILENVRGLVTHNQGNTLKTILGLLDDAGYSTTYKVLTSLDYGVPQMRQRVYFIGVNKDLGVDVHNYVWPEHKPVPSLDSYLVDERPISEWMVEYLPTYLNNTTNQGQYSVEDILSMEGKVLDLRMSDLRIYDGKVPTLRSQRDGILYVKNGQLFSLTGYEALLLQGFPREYADKVKDVVSDRHLLMQAGNAMTVNVIRDLGLSLASLISSSNNTETKNDNNMPDNNWKIFERDCRNYLESHYSLGGTITYVSAGGSNSNQPDINVFKNGSALYAIEAKMPTAQCGQFVLFANEATRSFTYSPQNEFPLNEFSQRIMNAMAADFDRYCEPSNDAMAIDASLFYDWIKNHYTEGRSTQFVMTKGNQFIIFPVNLFEKYFNVVARYRIKGSGSGNPPKKRQGEVEDALNVASLSYSKVSFNGDALNVDISNAPSEKFILQGAEYRYQFKKTAGNTFNVRKLSNTRNANVIFSISLKREQDADDLSAFVSSLQ